jgi:hypothetical protein
VDASQYVPASHDIVQAAGRRTHVCVASSQDSPDPHGKSGTSHPGIHAPEATQCSPAAQFAEEQVVMQVPLAVSQVPPVPHVPAPEHASLQTPSPESQVSPCGQPSVVQSAGADRHWEESVLQMLPAGQSDVARHPASQDNVAGEQY